MPAPAIHSGACSTQDKIALGLRPSVCCPLETKKRACHCGDLALQPELLELKLPFSDPT